MSRLGTAYLTVLLAAACGEVKSDAGSADDPVITSIAPDHGPAIGGIMVTVSGQHLGGADPVVVVDGTEATDATASGDGSVTFTLPPGIEGHVVDVSVGTDHGFGVTTAAFRYNQTPVILDITPKFGRFGGGTAVTITGRGFQVDEAGVPTVMIGGTAANSVQIIDDKTITATTAPADPTTSPFVPTDISITNANGLPTLEKSFTITKQGVLVAARGQMFFLDPTAKSAVALAPNGTLTRQLSGCITAPDGTILTHSRSPTTGRQELLPFDPITSKFGTPIGELLEGTTAWNATSLAFVGNSLFEISHNIQKFFSVNLTTAALTAVGAASGLISYHSSIAAKDGASVWLLSTPAGTTSLATITVASGAIAGGPALTGGPANVPYHAATVVSNVLYVASRNSPSQVFSVNTSSGALTLITSVAGTVNGMCSTPPAF